MMPIHLFRNRISPLNFEILNKKVNSEISSCDERHLKVYFLRGYETEIVVEEFPGIWIFTVYGVLISEENGRVNYEMMSVCCPTRKPIFFILFCFFLVSFIKGLDEPLGKY